MIGEQRAASSPGARALVERLACRRRRCARIIAVPVACALALGARSSSFERECAHQFEQLEAAFVGLAADETRLEQLIELGAAGRDRRPPRAPSGEAAEEHGRAAQHLLRAGAEQVIAPADRRL